ncbi:MAG: WD40 repeat domain-containing protein [Arcobacteraceae bacterium]|jgi:WD40 repeat protein
MKRISFVFFFLLTILYGITNQKPTAIYKASGNVQTMAIDGNKLYAGTINGTIEIFDIDSKKKIETITLPKIKDFVGDTTKAKVFSVDVIDGSILIVSQGEAGFRDVYLYKSKQLKKLISPKNKMLIQKVSFININSFVFFLLSNQIGVWDIPMQKQKYLYQISGSSFSHFMISENKKTLASTDESGLVRIIDTASGRITKNLPGVNLDKIYQLDYKKGVILTAGQDRKAVIYKNGQHSSLDFGFLLYSCALSPSADFGAIAYNENNDVLIINTTTKEKLYNLIGQESTMTGIHFKSETELFVSSESPKINFYKVRKK